MEERDTTEEEAVSKKIVNLEKASTLKHQITTWFDNYDQFGIRDNVLLSAAGLVLCVGGLEYTGIYIFVFGYLLIHTMIMKNIRLLLEFTISLMLVGWLIFALLILVFLMNLVSGVMSFNVIFLLLSAKFGVIPFIGLLLCKIAGHRFGYHY